MSATSGCVALLRGRPCELLVEPTSRKRDGPTVVNRLAQRPRRG
jgi:hypothetical protein